MMNIVVIPPSVLVVTVLILTHGFPAFSIPSPMISGRSYCCSRLFHRGIVFAPARRPVAQGSMIQSLLCRQHMGLLASPNLQSDFLGRWRSRLPAPKEVAT